MLLTSHFITLSVFFLTILGGSTALDKKKKASSGKDAKKFTDQQISVVGKLGCAGADASTVKAKIVLKVSRNGKQTGVFEKTR